MRRIVLLTWICGCCAGCAGLKTEWAYRKIALAASPTESLQSELPSSATRTTEGLSVREQARWPETEAALVILSDPAGKAGAKFLLTLDSQRFGSATHRRAVLRAEMVGNTTAGAAPGPVARLTEALRRLGKPQRKPEADRTHQLIGAAIIRLLESLPDTPPAQTDYQRFADTLSVIPANGAVTVTNVSPTTYRIIYRAAGTPR